MIVKQINSVEALARQLQEAEGEVIRLRRALEAARAEVCPLKVGNVVRALTGRNQGRLAKVAHIDYRYGLIKGYFFKKDGTPGLLAQMIAWGFAEVEVVRGE